MTTSLRCSTRRFAFDDHFGHLHVTLRRLVEGRRDHFTCHRPLHVGDFFGPLVDEQHDEATSG